jgi:hypothetical protein
MRDVMELLPAVAYKLVLETAALDGIADNGESALTVH